jgi:hypothetical protein
VAPNAILVNMSSPAIPATKPATPAAFRKLRREIGGMCGHPHGFVAGIGSSAGRGAAMTIPIT